jgi:hypothetical protein
MQLHNIPSWLRWILILPSAFVAGVIANIGVTLFYQFLTFVWSFSGSLPARYEIDPNNAFNFFFYRGAAGFADTFAFVYAGREMSPSAKRQVAIILALLMCLFSLIWLVSSITKSDVAQVLYASGGLIGAIVAVKLGEQE